MVFGIIQSTVDEIRAMNKRKLMHQFMSLGLIVCSAIMIWKSLCLVSGSESPVVVVLSGSMEPAFFRGDILFLWFGSHPFSVGEIVVFKIPGKPIPIVHRILEVHTDAEGEQKILTKGDHNPVDDRGLYDTRGNQLWLSRSDVLGRATGFLPYVGMVTITLTENPAAKFIIIGLMGLLVVTTKE
jgi:signal peptidase